MTRQRIVAAVVLVVALAAVAFTAVATHGASSLDVAGQHTTDSDFEGEREAVNVTISGGDVALNGSSGATLVDDYEDNDLAEYDNQTSVYSTVTDDPLEGSYTLRHEGTGSSPTEIASVSGLSNYPSRGDNVTMEFRAEAPDAIPEVFYLYQTSTASYAIRLNVRDDKVAIIDGGVGGGGGATTLKSDSASLVAATNYTVKLYSDTNSVGVKVKKTSNNNVVANFQTTDSSYSGHGIGFQDRNKEFWRFDILEIQGGGGSAPATGRWVGKNITADDATGFAVNTTLENATGNVTLEEFTDPGWRDVAYVNQTNQSTTNQTVSLTGGDVSTYRVMVNFTREPGTTTAELHDYTLLFDSRQPVVENGTADPQGGENLRAKDVNLSVVVEDPDLATSQGDSVDVEFQTMAPDEEQLTAAGTTTISHNTTTSQSITADVGGKWTWRVNVTDDYGNSITSANFTFNAPGNITIRNETNVSQTIDNVDVTGRFFSDREIVINTTADGVINMTGKPLPTAQDPLILTVEASGYHKRTAVIADIYETQNVYLLNDTSVVESDLITFELSDDTGNFGSDDGTRLIVERAINQSNVSNTAATGIEWTRVAGDTFGGANQYAEDLEHENRYRLRLKNDAGDLRVLGSFTPRGTEPITLNIGELRFRTEDVDIVGVNATRVNQTAPGQSGLDGYLETQYADPDGNATYLNVTVFEQGNRSNELFSEVFTSDPPASYLRNESLSGSEVNTTWVVNVTYTKFGDDHSVIRIVGGSRDTVTQPFAPEWRKTVVGGTVLFAAFAFGGVASVPGALVVAGVGGILWQMGWYVGSGGVVLLALVIAIAYQFGDPGGGQ